MKKQIIVVILLLLNSIIIFIPTVIVKGDTDIVGGNIVGDTIYWEVPQINVSCYPHTATGSLITQTQYLNVTWLGNNRPVDVAFFMDDACDYKVYLWDEDVEIWDEVSFHVKHGNHGGKHIYAYDKITMKTGDIYRFRWDYDVVANTSGKWDFLVKDHADTWDDLIIDLDPWWDASWDNYQSIYINPSYIDTNLSNFPLFVNITSDITSDCNSDGSDIRFLSSDNTTEFGYHFAEPWNPSSYNLIWVNVTYIYQDKVTVFHVYYGNSAASDNQNNTNVWSNGYIGVYYLNETTGNTVVDYSGNGNDGTYFGALPTRADGMNGYGQLFDRATSDYISLPSGAHIRGAGCVDMWVKKTSTAAPNEMGIFVDSDNDVSASMTNMTHCRITNAVDYRLDVYKDSVLECGASGSASDLNQQNLVTFNIGATTTALWKNTSIQITDTGTPPDETWDADYVIYVGRYLTGYDVTNLYLPAYVDELFISNVSRNSSWIKANYYSKSDTSSFLSWVNFTSGVETNTTTNVNETNATLNGWITQSDLLDGNYLTGFWYGTTFPLAEGSYDTNTSTGTFAINADFNYSVNGTLVSGTTYYVKAWISNSTYFGLGGHENFTTTPGAPTGFTLTYDSANNGVDIAWTHTGTTVVVRKNDSYPDNVSDAYGTIVYNGTGNSYDDNSIGGTYWFYSAWGYVNPFSNESVDANISVPPGPPANVSTNVLINNTFDIAWDMGNGAVTTVIRRKLDSYPTGITDGSEIFNTTGIVFNIQSTLNYYYSLWSYANLTYSSQENIAIGGLVLSCYDEETNESLWFDVSISNQDGSQTYGSRNNTNPLLLNISQLPIGNDIKITVRAASNYSEKSEIRTWAVTKNQTITYIVINQIPDSKSTTNVTCKNVTSGVNNYPPFTLADDLITILPDDADEFTRTYVNYTHEEYSSRLYYRDIDESSFGFLNAYLPPTENIELYLLEVRDEAINTVKDAYIEVKRNVNGTFVVVSRLLTDANGQADIYLISNKEYIFIISKDGYVTENASWTPGTLIFTHTFKIVTEIIPLEPDKFGDIISFYGNLYDNNTLRVTFYDLENAMTDSHFTVYENYDGVLTYMGEYNGTTENDIVFWVDVDNATRLHTIILFMNHTTLGEISDYRINVYPVHIDQVSDTWLENLIVSVVGEWAYGYVISFIWVFPCVLLIAGLAAIGHPGTGILGAGLYSFWITWNITMPNEARILTFASIALIVGFITVFLVKGKKVIHQ